MIIKTKSPEEKWHDAYGRAQEQAQYMTVKELAVQRRIKLKQMEFQGKTPTLLAQCKAIRSRMEKLING